jgi:hypothetical protein
LQLWHFATLALCNFGTLQLLHFATFALWQFITFALLHFDTLALWQNVYLEEDKTKNCQVYPNDEFLSYSACDDHFLQSSLPPGLIPLWLKDNMDQVTTMKVVDKFPNNSISYEDMFDGTPLSDCPLPCTTTSVETRLLAETTMTVHKSI